MCILDLDDVWRTLHPEEKQFTWRTSDLKIKCRLDYWLIARQLLQKSPVQKCQIKHGAHCDHSLVTMELQINVKYPILGDPGATSRDDVIFRRESLL